MTDLLLLHEPFVRLITFATVLAAAAGAEAIWPKRRRLLSRFARWPANLSVVALNTLLVRWLFPVGAVGLALAAEQGGWGLLNQWRLPHWLAVALAVAVLDLVIYLQHVLFHAVPALWRLHRMHHADLDFDVTTGSRFHPIEILLSFVIKLAVVAALGAPAISVLIFEVLLNATAMFNHANLALPTSLDRGLRSVLVTPDMHRVHHSVRPRETNSNFGFNLSCWDRLFGTYREAPEDGHEQMVIGVESIRDPEEQRLGRMLTQPFRAGDDRYAIGARD